MDSLNTQDLGLDGLIHEAKVVRKSIVIALHSIGGGHYGGSLSVVDILLVIYRRFLRINIEQPEHPDRDRLILSKGHSAIAQYSILSQLGFNRHSSVSPEMYNSSLPSHPDMTVTPGVDFSTGSLGQGLSVGLGMALARPDSVIWVILGDGECQEGQIWEAAMLSARLNVANLKVVVDCNGYQEFGQRYREKINDHKPVKQLCDKWNAFGWSVFNCNGNDHVEINQTVQDALNVVSKPTVILAKTVKGHGSQLLEKEPYRFHCGKLTESEYLQVIEELK